MSLVLMEGFHLYDNVGQMFDGLHGSRWTVQGPGEANTLELTGGEEGQPVLAVTWDGTNGQDYAEFAFPITNPIIFGGRWRWDSLPSSSMEFLHFRDQANFQCHFQCQNDGRLDLYLSSNIFRADSDPINPIIPGQWQDFEFKMNISEAATGTASVYVDGVQVMNAGPFDLKFTDMEGASEIRLLTEFAATGTIRWSDLYVLAVDGTPPNDHLKTFNEPLRVRALRPDADVAVDFAPSSGGNNFSRIDEAAGHDFDSGFNKSNVIGDSDIFDVPSVVITGSVKAVQVSYAARTDDGGPKNVRGFQRQGAIQDSGASNAIAVGFNIESDVFDVDANGAAWTKALLNTATFGYEIV